MNRRLYFVLPDVETAQQVENDLLLARVEEKRMHFLAKRGTDLKDLPEANVLQKTDLLHAMRLGLFFGGLTGVFLGVGLYMKPELIGMSISTGIIFVLGVFGALFGAWVSGMIGSSTPSTRLKEFEKTMDEGHILLILYVPKRRIKEVREVIRKHHPEVEDHGVDQTVPFP